MKPGDLIGVNKDSYLVLDTLPAEYDSRVKAMEVDERPTEQYTDIGGLDKQIEELVEAIVLPMKQADKFKTLGIKPPKGCLMYGPPGTGKTLLARACAAQTDACYLKLAGPSLVQMFIGDGAKLVRDAFELAKEKAPAIIFIDELDAIGTKRFDSDKSGDREVQRTMLELLNQLDGFSSDERIKVTYPLITLELVALFSNSIPSKVIAATNRIDILDPALLRSGRLDRKIEFPLPNETARSRILEIHSRKMNVGPGVNYDELARSTDEFNGAQLKAVSWMFSSTLQNVDQITDDGVMSIPGLCRSWYDCAPRRCHSAKSRAFPLRYCRRFVPFFNGTSMRTSWKLIFVFLTPQCKRRRKTTSCTSHNLLARLLCHYNSAPNRIGNRRFIETSSGLSANGSPVAVVECSRHSSWHRMRPDLGLDNSNKY